MKPAQSILDTMMHRAHFKTLPHHRCIRDFLKQLPPRLRKTIAFLVLRDDLLLVAASHPGYKMELNYSKDVLKSLLKLFAREHPECTLDFVRRVEVFVPTRGIYKARESEEETIPRYRELAEGSFRLPDLDDRFAERFERIRALIRRLNGSAQP